MSAPTCPLCAAPAAAPWFRKGESTVCRCGACGLAFTTGEWTAAMARAFYGAAYFRAAGASGYRDYAALVPALRATARRRLRRLPRAGRWLDLGCGPGVFLAEARDTASGVGCDVSAAACFEARARGLPVVVNEAAALPFAAASFDVVTMWDTIEHLAQPVAALQEVARVLRPGGLLVLTTGDVTSWCARLSRRAWHLFTLPEHRCFFSPATIARAVQAAGLTLRAYDHDGAHYTLAYLVERLLKSLLGNTGWVEPILQQRWPHRAIVYLNLFDIMTVEAVKARADG